MPGDPYSRLVYVLKVALPLVALALLSTLFLLSSRIDPGQSIPFSERELTSRIRSQQVTGPFFAGVTPKGDSIAFSAEQVVSGSTSGSEITDLSARMQLANGGSVAVVADRGQLLMTEDRAALEGGVLIESSVGYVMRTDALTAHLSELVLESPGEVRATGPGGALKAGRLRISRGGEMQHVQLLFSGGVKLIYEPKANE